MYDHELEDLVRLLITRYSRLPFIVPYYGTDFYGPELPLGQEVTKAELIERFGQDDADEMGSSQTRMAKKR